MYTEQDYQDILSQERRRRWALLSLCVLLLAAVAASFVFRVQALTVGLTILLGIVLILGHGVFLAPVTAYRKHLDTVLHGRVHSVTGLFKQVEKDVILREGVRFYPLLINVGDLTDEEDDRLLYFDANLPLPAWQVGDRITVWAHDRAMGDWKRAEEEANRE